VNIAMVSEHASPLAALGGVDAGGQNVHVAELSAALVRAGHRVTVYTRRDDVRLPKRVTMPSGVAVEHVPAGPPQPISKDDLLPYMDRFAQRLGESLALDPVDVVHAHFWMSGRAALAAALALQIPVVTTFHALGAEKRRMRGQADTSPAQRLAEESRIARSSTRIVATSSSEVFELGRLGAEARCVRLIPCGVDVDFFRPGPPALSPAKRHPHRVVTLSRLVERKGVADVITALEQVPDTELIVAGGPPASELPGDAEARRLSAHAEALGVAGRVTLLGRVERDDIPGLLRTADAVVCAAWYEPFGIVPLEAMACAIPVIATAVGGQSDTILDGFTGLHVPARAPGAIAEALGRLFESRDLGVRLGAAGRARAISRFTWDKVGADTAAVYREFVSPVERIGITA
jgi:D-inositol-3-phosphate glycosyltransferase